MKFKPPFDDGGTRVWREVEEFDSSGGGAHPHWPDRFFARIVDAYLRQTSNAGALVLDARGLLQLALTVMRAVARDADAARNLLDPLDGT